MRIHYDRHTFDNYRVTIYLTENYNAKSIGKTQRFIDYNQLDTPLNELNITNDNEETTIGLNNALQEMQDYLDTFYSCYR